MEFHILPFLAFLSVVVVASHAAISPEAYWKSVLPNTPMPKAVKDLLPNEWMADKDTSVRKPGKRTNVGVGKGDVSVSTGHKGKPVYHKAQLGIIPTLSTYGAAEDQLHDNPKGTSVGKPEKRTNVGVGKGGVSVSTGHKGKPVYHKPQLGIIPTIPTLLTTYGAAEDQLHDNPKGTSVGKPEKRTNVGVGKGGVSVSTGHKGKPVYHKPQLGIIPTIPTLLTTYGAAEDQLHDNPNVALFFMEKDLKKGTKMPLHFTKSTTPTTFLPRQVAKKIPFSSDKMPEIMNYFSVKPDSKEAEIMKKTVKECEEPEIKGEEKYCATSLESMVDFSTNKLGKNIQGVSTEVDRETQLQKYSITGVEKMAGDRAVVCHKQVYAYAVFYCHKIQTTKEYVVSLVGADGTKAKAVAVCHMDTSAWNPKHLAFQVLKVKPGTVPICHFLPEDSIVWVPK